MGIPRKYAALTIKQWSTDTENPVHGWIPARPISLGGLRLIHRLKLSWGVFIGKHDVVDWEKKDEAKND